MPEEQLSGKPRQQGSASSSWGSSAPCPSVRRAQRTPRVLWVGRVGHHRGQLGGVGLRAQAVLLGAAVAGGLKDRVGAPGVCEAGRRRGEAKTPRERPGQNPSSAADLAAAAAGGDHTDVPSAIAAGLGRTPGGHSLPLQCPKLPGSTPAPMVGRDRLGAPMGQSGGGVSAWSSRPSCASFAPC